MQQFYLFYNTFTSVTFIHWFTRKWKHSKVARSVSFKGGWPSKECGTNKNRFVILQGAVVPEQHEHVIKAKHGPGDTFM